MKKLLVIAVLWTAWPGSALAEEKKVWDRQFSVATGLLIASTVADIESTQACFPGCKEANPLLGAGGRGQAYGMKLGLDAGILTWAYLRKKNGHRDWWWPLAIAAGIQFGTGTVNLRFQF